MADARIPLSLKSNASVGATEEDTPTTSSYLPFTSNISNASAINSNSGDILGQLGFNPLPNILNNYDGATYNFQFSLLNPYDASKKIIIAESGSTVIDIISVESVEYLQPNFRSKNSTWTSFEMTLFEPMGSNFLDMVAEAAVELSVPNISKTVFNLKLSFKGYDPSTGTPISIGGTWNWPVIILTMDTTMNESGCTYKLQLLRATDIPSTNDAITIPQGFQFSGTTLGQCLNDLAGKLNDQMQQLYSCPFIVYKIAAQPYPSTADAGIATPLDLVVQDPNNILAEIRNPDGGHVASGTNLSDLITSLASNSEVASKLASCARTVDNKPADNSAKKPSVFMLSVITDVKFGAYQEAFGDYEKTLTYTLIPYETYKPITNIANAKDIQDPSYCTKKVKAMITNNVLNKDYEYVFTGENTEILDMQIQSNFSYVVIQEYLEGFIHTNTIAAGQVNNTSNVQKNVNSIQQQYQSLQTQKKQYIDQLNSVNNSLNQLNATSNPITGSVGSSSQGNANWIQQSADLSAQKLSITANIQTIQNQMDLMAQTDPDDTINYASNQRLAIQQKLASEPTLQYVDSYNEEKIQENYATLYSIGVRSDISDSTNTTHYHVDSSQDNRRSMYSAMMDQMYEQTGDTYQTINLTIRGDPYWLGSSFMNDNYVFNSTSTVVPATKSNDSLYQPAIMFTDLSFVLRYNTPNGFDENGQPILKRNDYFTGFYGVVSVTHMWDRGQYKQKLMAYRIPGIMLSNLLNSSAGV